MEEEREEEEEEGGRTEAKAAVRRATTAGTAAACAASVGGPDATATDMVLLLNDLSKTPQYAGLAYGTLVCVRKRAGLKR